MLSQSPADDLALIIHQLPIAVLVAESPSGRLIHWSHVFESLFGEPIHESDTAASYCQRAEIHRDTTCQSRRGWALERAISQGESTEGEEVRLRGAEGTCRILILNAAPLRDREANIIGAVMTAADVTEQRMAEERLRFLEQAINNVNDVVMITEAHPIDAPGPRIVFVNQAFERMTGYKGEEVSGRNPRFLQGPETDRAALDRVRAALTAGKPVREQVRNYRKDGTPFWAELDITPLLDSAGQLSNFVSVQRNVTERRRFEEALAQSKRRLDEAQQVAQIGSWEWDVKEDIAYWSDEMYRMCGLEPQSRVMTRSSFREFVHPEDQPSLKSLVDNALATGESFDCQFRITRTDGILRHMQTRACMMCRSDGTPLRLIGTLQDITEKLEADQARLRAAELEASNRELQSFSYAVAHDLRAPMGRILSYTDIINEEQNQLGLTDEAKFSVQGIVHCARHMMDLIEALLAVSQVTRSPLRREACDMSGIASAILTELSRAEPHRRVTARVAPNLTAYADTRLVHVVLQNLLANSWKFTRPKPEAVIEVGEEISGRQKVFFVRDNGVGFDPAHKQHLFKPFERLHRTGAFEGSGIGLATVHRIIQSHGGRVWAEGTVNKGAVFYFTFE